MLEKTCCGGDTIILACSGGSNVGQIANDAAKALTGLGVGRMYCAIGVGAGLENFIKTTREAAQTIAIDGCAVGCVKKAMQNAGLEPTAWVVVTELGIEKKPGFEVTQEQLAQVVGAVDQALGGSGEASGACCE